MEMKKRNVWIGILFLGLVVSLVLNGIVAFTTPIVFGDEGYYAARGEWIAQKLQIPDYFHIYSGGTDVMESFFLDSPQMFFTTASFFLAGGEGLVKLMDPLLMILTSLTIFLFVRRAVSERAGTFAALSYVVLPNVITYAVFLYKDQLTTLLAFSALYLLYRALDQDSYRYLTVSGILASFALLSKPTAFVLIPFYLVAIPWMSEDREWREQGKWIGTVLVLMALITAPWFLVHNYMNLGNPGLPKISSSFPDGTYTGPEPSGESSFAGRTAGTGTDVPLLGFGLMDFFSFAYTIPMFILAAGGAYLLFRRERNMGYIASLFFLLLYFGVIQFGGFTRTEDFSRWVLPASPIIAMSAGLFLDEFYQYLGEYRSTFISVSVALFVSLAAGMFLSPLVGAALAVIYTALYGLAYMADEKGTTGNLAIHLVVLFLLSGFVYSQSKTGSLRPIKEFSPAFFQGCDWIQENTEEDARLLTMWAHRAYYNCKRDSFWTSLPTLADIVVTPDEESYEHLKLHGIDYVYVQKFSISARNIRESYPVDFVRYIQSSDNFQPVYEHPEGCMGQRNVRDCVIVYEVK